MSPALNKVVRQGCSREGALSVITGKHYHLLRPLGVQGLVLSTLLFGEPLYLHNNPMRKSPHYPLSLMRPEAY